MINDVHGSFSEADCTAVKAKAHKIQKLGTYFLKEDLRCPAGSLS